MKRIIVVVGVLVAFLAGFCLQEGVNPVEAYGLTTGSLQLCRPIAKDKAYALPRVLAYTTPQGQLLVVYQGLNVSDKAEAERVARRYAMSHPGAAVVAVSDLDKYGITHGKGGILVPADLVLEPADTLVRDLQAEGLQVKLE